MEEKQPMVTRLFSLAFGSSLSFHRALVNRVGCTSVDGATFALFSPSVLKDALTGAPAIRRSSKYRSTGGENDSFVLLSEKVIIPIV